MNPRRRLLRITPSRTSVLFLLLCLAVWLAAANYMNNLAYIFLFLMGSFYISSYFRSRLLFQWLMAVDVNVEPAFAGGMMRMELTIENRSAHELEAVFFIPEGDVTAGLCFGPRRIPAKEKTLQVFSIPAPRRGLYRIHSFRVLSLEPLGFFRSCLILPVEAEYLVYPQPSGRKSWHPPTVEEEEAAEGFHTSGGDDFSGYRVYRTGESQRHIDWKVYARGRPLAVKEFTGGGAMTLWFDWDHLPGVDREERLSQLTRWILGADRTGQEFGLKLPAESVAPDSGTLHTLRCLRLLALYPGDA